MNKEGTKQDGIVLPTQPEALLLEEFAQRLKRLVNLHEELVTNPKATGDTVVDFDRQVRPEMEKLQVFIDQLIDQLEQSPMDNSNLVQVLLWTASNIVDTINLTVEQHLAGRAEE